jgi:hypothetical protein
MFFFLKKKYNDVVNIYYTHNVYDVKFRNL